jgi:hypothetical protein
MRKRSVLNALIQFSRRHDLSSWMYKIVGKEHYRYFLRLNNRKRRVRLDHLQGGPYFSISLATFYQNRTKPALNETDDWCASNFPKGSWIRIGYTLFFAREKDALLFKLRYF